MGRRLGRRSPPAHREPRRAARGAGSVVGRLRATAQEEHGANSKRGQVDSQARAKANELSERAQTSQVRRSRLPSAMPRLIIVLSALTPMTPKNTLPSL